MATDLGEGKLPGYFCPRYTTWIVDLGVVAMKRWPPYSPSLQNKRLTIGCSLVWYLKHLLFQEILILCRGYSQHMPNPATRTGTRQRQCFNYNKPLNSVHIFIIIPFKYNRTAFIKFRKYSSLLV